MIKKFLTFTDNFLSKSVQNIFEKTEQSFNSDKQTFNLFNELKNLEEDPLGCTIGNNSKFESSVKMKIKIILGIFFVLVPLLGFGFLSYLVSFHLTYSFLLTLTVAILVASRMEEIVKRYVESRTLQAKPLS